MITDKKKWDQKKLKDLFLRIKKGGNNPHKYINVEYSIDPEKYEDWPEVLKDMFRQARTRI